MALHWCNYWNMVLKESTLKTDIFKFQWAYAEIWYTVYTDIWYTQTIHWYLVHKDRRLNMIHNEEYVHWNMIQSIVKYDIQGEHTDIWYLSYKENTLKFGIKRQNMEYDIQKNRNVFGKHKCPQLRFLSVAKNCKHKFYSLTKSWHL
jgi:hypothetical protein